MASTVHVWPASRRFTLAGSVAAIVAYVAVYSTLLCMDGAPWAVVSESMFVAPVAIATVLFGRVALHLPPAGRNRRVWASLAVSAACLFVSESAWSISEVFEREGVSSLTWLRDVANGAAVCAMMVAMALYTRFDRFGWRRGLRLVLDATAFSALTFGILYGFWSGHPVATHPEGGAGRLAAYGLVGCALLAGDAMSFARGGFRGVEHDAFIAAGVALIAFGVITWAVSGLSTEERPTVSSAASNAMLLAAYCLMCAAAWWRLRGADREVLRPGVVRKPLVWPGVVVSSLVFVSVVWLGASALATGPGTKANAVYLYAASLAVCCVVGRTALASVEADELTERSLSDPLTGVRGPRAFATELREIAERAAHAGGSLALLCADLDDFSRFNATQGYRAGDRCLVSVARALEQTEGVERLFRLSGDEFVVVSAVQGSSEAQQVARSLLESIRSCGSQQPLSASVGFALYPEDSVSTDGLLRFARLATQWAKRHGKDRASRYDERIARTLSLDERLARSDELARMDMARALLAAADARDPSNRWHSRNVAALCRLLAEDLELEADHVDRIEVAAILHDVGKIALPDVMLGGRTLSFHERTLSREHARLGEKLVDSLALEGVGRWVRGHHESWDGSGYPDGLKGEDIPLESRIIALADAYDGMTMGKRYGAPISKAAALQEIDLGIGVRFDPELAERFIRVVGTTGALGWSDAWPAT